MSSVPSSSRPSKSVSATGPRRSTARSTRGILEARVKKLSANQCAIGRLQGRATCSHDDECKCHRLGRRLRAELLSLATRPLGQPAPLAMQLDSFTFQPADASQVALFFNTYGRFYHIRKFSLKTGSNENKTKDDASDSDDSGSDDAASDDTPVVETVKSTPVAETPKVPAVKAESLLLDTPGQIEPYIIAINNLPFLEEISFAGVSIGIWAAYPLAAALRNKKKLRRADFSNIFVKRAKSEIAPALDALVSAFLELPNLESIDLGENALGPEVEWPLLRLVRNHTPLQELRINNVGLGPQTGAAFARALAELAKNKAAAAAAGGAAPPLRELHASRNRLKQDDDELYGMADWAAGLAAHPGLRTLSFANNGVNKGGMDLLVSQGLARLREIEVLDLQDNTFTERGSTHRALADAVGGWPALRVLNLNDALLGSRGAALLIPALAAVQPSRLESLKLKANNISPANTLALSGVLWRLPELREVQLRRNNIAGDDEGYRIISEALRERKEQRGFQINLDKIREEPESEPSQSPRSSQQQASP